MTCAVIHMSAIPNKVILLEPGAAPVVIELLLNRGDAHGGLCPLVLLLYVSCPATACRTLPALPCDCDIREHWLAPSWRTGPARGSLGPSVSGARKPFPGARGKTARQATFDCRFDQVGYEERERDRHVDLPDTASFARGRVQPYSLLPGRPFR
jgi:hypothetical protein